MYILYLQNNFIKKYLIFGTARFRFQDYNIIIMYFNTAKLGGIEFTKNYLIPRTPALAFQDYNIIIMYFTNCKVAVLKFKIQKKYYSSSTYNIYFKIFIIIILN